MTQKLYEVFEGDDEFIELEPDDEFSEMFTGDSPAETVGDLSDDGNHIFYSEPQPLDLKIEFGETKWGLMDFVITLGEQSFNTRFSNAFDPLPDLKCWLEAIAIGVQQCSFQWDGEGPDYKFDLQRAGYPLWRFTVGFPYEVEEEVSSITGNVDRRQLVKTLYQGFLNYDASPDFDRDEWEPECWDVMQLKDLRSELIDKFLAETPET